MRKRNGKVRKIATAVAGSPTLMAKLARVMRAIRRYFPETPEEDDILYTM